MDLESCTKLRVAKAVKPDTNLAKSLLESSAKKMKSQSMLRTDDDTAASKVTLAYDALREMLEAVSVLRGYKIYNHECYTYFIKEVLGDSRLGDKFDRLRRIRNGINYYGAKISPPEAIRLISEITSVLDFVRTKHLPTSRAS